MPKEKSYVFDIVRNSAKVALLVTLFLAGVSIISASITMLGIYLFELTPFSLIVSIPTLIFIFVSCFSFGVELADQHGDRDTPYCRPVSRRYKKKDDRNERVAKRQTRQA